MFQFKIRIIVRNEGIVRTNWEFYGHNTIEIKSFGSHWNNLSWRLEIPLSCTSGGYDSVEVTVNQYNNFSIVISRLIEILINLALTFWLPVDGFSSFVVARSTIRNYLMVSEARVLDGDACLKKAIVNVDYVRGCLSYCTVYIYQGY